MPATGSQGNPSRNRHRGGFGPPTVGPSTKAGEGDRMPTITGPTVVGINRTQDASFAVTRGGDTMHSLQKERISRRKHHWGRLGDVERLYKPMFAPLLRDPIDLVVECYSSDSEIANLDAYRDELRATLPLKEDARFVLVSHHLT